jgi:RNA polymerase sigma-70 factor (ECF subfamily)
VTGASAKIDAMPRELAEQRFADLYRENARGVLGYALRRSMDPDDAADVVAETFLIAWRRLAEVPSDNKARLWLYGTARHVLANQDRGARRRDRLTERLRGELCRELPAAQPEEESVFLQALAGLKDMDRELLMLIGWEELTPTEAAEVLGISPFAARTRLHRARRRLRGRLAEDPSGQHTEIEVEEAP